MIDRLCALSYMPGGYCALAVSSKPSETLAHSCTAARYAASLRTGSALRT